MCKRSFLLSFLLFFVCYCGFGKVELGIDVLEATDFKCLRGKRVGVLTNNACRDSNGKFTWEVMLDYMVDVRAIFAPEHGLDISAIADKKHNNIQLENIVVYACYGADAYPKHEWLKDLDVVVIDLQDIGVRYYTYVSSMIYMMFACFEHNINVVVLDRPNPIGGFVIGGPCMSERYNSFLGCIPGAPLLHGMTIGEIALYIKDYASKNGLFIHENYSEGDFICGLDVDSDASARGMLSVVKMNNWRRGMLWGDTSLTFNKTSPRIQNEKSCYDYAILSMASSISAPYSDAIKFYCINEHTVDISARYFACFSVKNVSKAEILEDLASKEYDSAVRGVKLIEVDDSEVEKFLLKIDDFSKIEPCALILYLIYKTQKPGIWDALNDEMKMLIYKHIGDEELVDKMFAGEEIDFVYFINKWRAQANDFKKASSKFYLYR